MRQLYAVLGLTGVVVAVAMAGSASAAPSPALTRVVRPQVDQVVGNGRVQIALRTRSSLAALRVTVDGHSVKRHLRRTARGYRGVIRLRRGLRYGVNELLVATRGSADFDRVKFIVARRNSDLVRMSGVHVRGREAPARVVVRPAVRSTLQAWMNGHRVEHAFQPSGRRFVGRLGANDWVRPGRNRLVVLTHRTSRRGRHAVYDVERETFWHKRGRVIAGAGRDRVFSAGGFVTLRGSARAGGPPTAAAPAVRHRWKITSAPPGAHATLHGARSARPELLATTPGYYRIRTRVAAPNGSFSVDTATVAVRADVPPLGWRLDTTDDSGTITLDGKPIARTTWPSCGSGTCASMSWAVLNRQTLEVVESGNAPGDGTGLKLLADKVDASYKSKPFFLVAVNLSGASAALPDGKRLLGLLGVDTTNARPALQRPLSIVGVPNSPKGSAFISDPRIQCATPNVTCPPQPQHLANMTGYLRLNTTGVGGGWFEFVFGDQVGFDTDAAPAAGKITMTVGDATYAQSTPTDGSSGFVLMLLDSDTLQPNRPPQLIRTNNPDRSEIPDAEVVLKNLLTFAASPYNGHGELLVMLQAFGTPRGLDGAWLSAAAAIERLGGNAQIFAQLNQGNAEEPFQGRYAFVGRSAMETAGAEASQSLTGLEADSRLRGLLTRGRDAQYQPVLADAAGTVNAELVQIVNRPIAPNNGFPVFTAGEAGAAEFLGREVLELCPSSEEEPCDVRRAYYDRDGIAWATKAGQLNSDGTKTKCRLAAEGAGAVFTEQECNGVREQFANEISDRASVAAYFGPDGLQKPFFSPNANPALVDVSKIAAEITASLPPLPKRSGAHDIFTILGQVTALAGKSGSVCPQCAAVAGGLGGAFSVGAYLTKDNGTPDIIGPQVSKEATALGGELLERYSRASSYFDTEAEIVMSDYTKMRDVARRAGSDRRWILKVASAQGQLEAGTRQAMYKALVPVAYPVLYDLGPMRRPASARDFNNAREWLCAGNVGYAGIFLFQRTDDGAQLHWKTTNPDPQFFGQVHLIAVGEEHATGSSTNAYIPGPPKALTDKLFRPLDAPTADGVGLYPLEFYSPRYFTVFPRVFRMDDASGWTFCHRLPDPPGWAAK